MINRQKLWPTNQNLTILLAKVENGGRKIKGGENNFLKMKGNGQNGVVCDA